MPEPLCRFTNKTSGRIKSIKCRIFFGLDFVATVPPTVALTGKFFGSANGPVVFGWVFSAPQFGSGFAA